VLAARLTLAMMLLVMSCKREERSAPKPEAWSAPPPPKASPGEWTWHEVGRLAASATPAIGRALPFSRAVVWTRPPQIFDAKQRAFHAAAPWPSCADAPTGQLAVIDDEIVFAVGAKCGYDAEQDKWVPVPELAPKGTGWTATMLSKGDLLLCGGSITPSLWDHKQKALVTLPPTSVPHDAALLLLDGTVLLTSKKGEKMELYQPSQRTFRALEEQKYDGQPAVMGDGRVMFLTNDGGCGLYDPASTKWSTCPSMRTPRTDFALAIVEDGVLVTGGTDPASKTATASVELYELKRESWIELPPMPVARARHVALRLSDESVLVAGGSDDKRAFLLTRAKPDAGP
jgi:hypothetical protein